MSSSLDRMMAWELRDVIKKKDERIRELEAEITKLKEEKRGTPYYCEPDGPACANVTPLCYENEMEDCDRVSCTLCKRMYEVRDHGCDGFELIEIEE